VTTLIIGCGYLGQHLGIRLHQQGERVFGTVRSPGRAAVIAALGIEAVIADVLVPESLGRLPEADRVFYSVGYDRAAGSSMRAVYVDGLQNVLDKLPQSVKRFVYAGSTGVYGQINLIHIDDDAQAASAALAAVQPEPIYVVSDDRPVMRKEYYSRMATLLGTPDPVFEPATHSSSESARDATNKRVANHRIKSILAADLIYPDITTGLRACVGARSQP
jgi:nucleoside-diphosphate-sugar epimerase